MSFVEKATLILDDQSSKGIRKINSELGKLMSTAKKLKSALKGINVDIGNVTKATRDVKKLREEFDKLSKKSKINVDSSSVTTALSRVKTLHQTLSKQPKTIVIGANTSRISQAMGALKSLHNLASKPVNQTVNVNRKFNGKDPGFGPGGGQQRISVDIMPMKGMLNEFMHDFRNALLNYGYNATKKGTVTEDISRTNLLLQNYGPKTNEQIITAADQIARNNGKINGAQMLDIMNEVLGMTSGPQPIAKGLSVTGPNVESAKVVTEQLARYVTLTMMRTGKSFEEASDGVYKIARAFDAAGFLQNDQGIVDPANVEKWMGNFIKASVVGGREMTPELLQHTMKLLRVSKFGLNERGFFTAMSLAEMMGSTAGVGINQMIKQLSGKGVTKETLAFQELIGLIKTKEVDTGSTGKRKTRSRVVDYEVNEENREYLRNDPLGYVSNVVIPALRKSGQLKTLTSEEDAKALAEKILPPVDAIDKAGQLTSDRTATDMLATLLIISNNLERDVARAQGLDVSDERLDQIQNQSLLVNLQGVNNQVQGLIGDLANSLEGVLIPALQKTNSTLGGISEYMRSDTNSNEVDPVKGGVVVAGAAAATAFIAAWVKSKVVKTASTLLGKASSVASVASNPAGKKAAGKFPFMRALGSAWGVAEVIASADEYKKKTGKDDGILQALTDIIADAIVTGREVAGTKDDWKQRDAEKVINSLPFTELPPMNRAEERDAGMFDQPDLTTRFQRVFDTGASSIQTAGDAVITAIPQAGQSAAQSILNTAQEFGSTAGAAMAAAVRAVVANINIKTNVNQTVGAAPAVDTGKMGGPR